MTKSGTKTETEAEINMKINDFKKLPSGSRLFTRRRTDSTLLKSSSSSTFASTRTKMFCFDPNHSSSFSQVSWKAVTLTVYMEEKNDNHNKNSTKGCCSSFDCYLCGICAKYRYLSVATSGQKRNITTVYLATHTKLNICLYKK